MRQVKLSICIPTYNFGAFIGAMLESVLHQMTDDVEIVILDGGSVDDTPNIVNGLINEGANIRYHRQEARGGIDRDMASCVAKAQGEYCWLFSADDIVRPGTLNAILATIQTGQDVYLFKHTMCTFDMYVQGERAVLTSQKTKKFDLADASQRVSYFQLAQTTEAFFSFLGTIVFRRTVWNHVTLNERFVGSCWAHVARFMEILPVVEFVPVLIADRRGDNDSFADKGVVNRYRIAIDGYNDIADFFWGSKSLEAFHIRRVIRHEFGLRAFLAAKISCANDPKKESSTQLKSLARLAYSDTPLRRGLLLLLLAVTPIQLYAHIRGAVRLCKRMAS